MPMKIKWLKTTLGSLIAVTILSMPMEILSFEKNEPERVRVIIEEDPLPEIEEVVEEAIEPELISLGEFRLTAYCSCEICCGEWAKYNKTKSGTTPEQGRTIAVDENQIPLGSTVIIDGIEYIAEDTGSAIKENCIDVYHYDHNEAKEFGVQYKEVFVRR